LKYLLLKYTSRGLPVAFSYFYRSIVKGLFVRLLKIITSNKTIVPKFRSTCLQGRNREREGRREEQKH
jgi:hypothetical protein